MSAALHCSHTAAAPLVDLGPGASHTVAGRQQNSARHSGGSGRRSDWMRLFVPLSMGRRQSPSRVQLLPCGGTGSCQPSTARWSALFVVACIPFGALWLSISAEGANIAESPALAQSLQSATMSLCSALQAACMQLQHATRLSSGREASCRSGQLPMPALGACQQQEAGWRGGRPMLAAFQASSRQQQCSGSSRARRRRSLAVAAAATEATEEGEQPSELVAGRPGYRSFQLVSAIESCYR